MFSKQETFEVVYKHLMYQGTRSLGFGALCAYRGKNGTKCAIGCLIKDEFYSQNLEYSSVSGSKESIIIEAVKNSGYYCERAFLTELQRIHDFHTVSNWKVVFNQLVRNTGSALYGLNIPEI